MISSAILSHDRKNMTIKLEPNFNVDEYNWDNESRFTVKSGGTTYTVSADDLYFSYNAEEITFELNFENPLPDGTVEIEMYAEDLKTYANEQITENLFYDQVDILPAAGVPSAYYENGRIEIKYDRLADGTRGKNRQLMDAAGALLPEFGYIIMNGVM